VTSHRHGLSQLMFECGKAVLFQQRRCPQGDKSGDGRREL
jgi:hypothetical protein